VKARHLAWAISAATAALAIATSVLAFVNDGTRLPESEANPDVSFLSELVFSVFFVTFAALGALLASRRPRNPISWILCLSPFALGISGLALGWYIHAFYTDPDVQPPPVSLIWLANWVWAPGFGLLITALLLLFPDGRLPSRRWWPAGALVGGVVGALSLGYAFEPGAMEDFPQLDNPLGLGGGLGEAMAFLQDLVPLLGLAALASVAALVSRFRRSRGVERQQLKWMAAAAGLAVTAFFLNAVLDQVFGVNSFFMLPLALLAIPAAATTAILRYRLYDLGRIVNRTLVYGALTLTLAAIYLGLVLLVGLAVGQSDLAIAASTLAIAALFRPARARIQAIVDRRFYRRRYDAAETLAAFSGRLRHEVDVDAVGAELRAAVSETVQPAHLTLWMPTDRRTT
jgi:hypothetical protein